MSAGEILHPHRAWPARLPKRFHGRVRRLPITLVTGAGLFGGALLLAAVTKLFLADPNRQDLSGAYAAPGTAGHLLGTDPLGRDVLAWVGGSITIALAVSLSVVILSTLIGVTIGMIAGYWGGVIDSILMRLVDLQLAVPPVLLFISVSAVVDTTLFSLILLLTVPGWVPYARIVRTRIQVERERSSVIAARLGGASRRRIFLRDLVPAVATLVLVLGSLQAGYVMLWEASLSFLGLGVQPPDTSLGFIIAQGRETLVDAWWVVLFPGLALVGLILASNLVGDGLRDLFGVEVEVFDRD